MSFNTNPDLLIIKKLKDHFLTINQIHLKLNKLPVYTVCNWKCIVDFLRQRWDWTHCFHLV